LGRRSSKDGAQSDPQDVDTAEVEEKSNRIFEAVEDLREAIPQAEPAISDSRPALELYLSEVANYTKAVRKYLIHSSISEPLARDT
jgi:predicted component of type VI protein secretion system